jgi:lysophospholipase L1-like esterase
MPPPLHILCFGDSLTQGYHGFGAFTSPYGETLEERLQEAFPHREIKVVTSGVAGDVVCASRFATRMNEECKFT